MKRISIFALLLSLFFLQACVKEQEFGPSSLKQILYFAVPGQSGLSEIKQDSLIIRLRVGAQTNVNSLAPDSIQLSSYAGISPAVGEPQDFRQPVAYTVRAEDGSEVVYTVIVQTESSNPQLDNSGWDAWYTPAGRPYQEPGLNDQTIWATGNAGVVTIGTANVNPVTVSGTDLAAELVTRDLGALGQLAGQRMGAGSLFTGTFVLDIQNPINSARMGIPFTARPTGFTVAYQYTPGTPYRNGTGQVLTKVDSCDIYLLLENRTGTEKKRIATGWFRSGVEQTSFSNISIPLTYGILPAGTPEYMLPAGGLYAAPTDPVTHISFVAASSANGAFFEGGTNSKLVLNNLSLQY